MIYSRKDQDHIYTEKESHTAPSTPRLTTAPRVMSKCNMTTNNR